MAEKPFQISAMAEAFHWSGSHAREADSAFDMARKQRQRVTATLPRAIPYALSG
ncbi:hypothetical protein ACIBG0_38415 [Nocardia sp. NPDC050630]|uniref:putative alpha/beta hydrolase n=1 Tax=Nocardia sp. NPDC050630 TaxID=3364321 RepID=UPI0037A45581